MALQGGITYVTLNPVIAWRVNSTFSIAAGLNVNYARADLENGVLLSSFPANRFTFKGDGYSLGFNLGLLWQPAKEHSFGVSYHSESTMDISGQSTAVIPTAGLYSTGHPRQHRFYVSRVHPGGLFLPPDTGLEPRSRC